jgi:hypothetical protein
VRARLTVIARSIRSTISPLQGITATLITLGTGAGPGLVHHGHGGLAVYASRVPGWWPVIPTSLLVILALVKATCALEGKHDALKARLADQAQRKTDAAELGALRLRMRKRHLDWLKEQNHGVRMLGFAPAHAQALRSEIGARLEARYGIDVRERFIGAADDATRSLSGLLSESQAYAGRIKRLRAIISDVRRGRIQCR